MRLAAWAMRIGRGLGYGLLAIMILAVAGTVAPAVPVIGDLGPGLLTAFGVPIILLLLVGALLCLWRWRALSTPLPAAIAILCVPGALGAAFVVQQHLATAWRAGITINLVEAATGASGPALSKPQTVTYTRHEGAPIPLDIYRPTGRTDGKPAPVILYIHGGGWISGGYRDRISDLRWFTDRGFLVISLEYSLSGKESHLWNVTQGQLGCAMNWVGSHVGPLGGDPRRIAMLGESAGGNLVLNLAYAANNGRLRANCPGKLPHIAASVALYPVVDVADFYRNDDLLLGGFARKMAEQYTGGSPERLPGRYQFVSSETYISAAAPPTLLFIPDDDSLVPPGPAYRFAERAKAAGASVTLLAIPHASHGFERMPGSVLNQLFRSATLRFLEQAAR